MHGSPCSSQVKCCTLDVIGRTAFGHDFGAIDSLTTGRTSDVADAFQWLLEDMVDF